MPRRRLTLAFLGALLASGAHLAGGAVPGAWAAPPTVVSPADAQPVDGDWLISHLEAEPGTLNPITASDSYESSVNGYVYESLLTRTRTRSNSSPSWPRAGPSRPTS